jgi:hypothetical protein
MGVIFGYCLGFGFGIGGYYFGRFKIGMYYRKGL